MISLVLKQLSMLMKYRYIEIRKMNVTNMSWNHMSMLMKYRYIEIRKMNVTNMSWNHNKLIYNS